MVRAKKSLGQHFLRSEKALSDIVHASILKKDDIVLEIGPGEGVLTRRLLKEGAYVVAVEKDDLLFEKLCLDFKKEIENKKLKIVHGDIIDVYKNLGLKKGRYKLVANIPYYLTGMILKHFISYEMMPSLLVLLVQKEVAERIVAKNKKQSVLSVITSLFGNSAIVSIVKKGSFVPPPKVDSAIISIWPHKKSIIKDSKEETIYVDTIKAGFLHKRKYLAKNLEELFEEEIIEKAFEESGLSKNIRAEDLSLEDWISLIKSILNKK